MDDLYRRVPAGVGRGYRKAALTTSEVRDVLTRGAEWTVSRGYGWPEDLAYIEDRGRLLDAHPEAVSGRAVERGRDQLGTVGSGTTSSRSDSWTRSTTRRRLGAWASIGAPSTVLIHSGSRGLGYQVCDDYLETMLRAAVRYGIELPDRQLACAPVDSVEGRRYIGAMRGAANYAFASRQMMGHQVRCSFAELFRASERDLGMALVYDVAHNNAKPERYTVDGEERELWVHRRGATRAFPPGHPHIVEAYRDLGQPVFIPGDMGRYSLRSSRDRGRLRGDLRLDMPRGRPTEEPATGEAGRPGPRSEAGTSGSGESRCAPRRCPLWPKSSRRRTRNVSDVVDVVDRAGIGRKVVRLRPLGVLKG